MPIAKVLMLITNLGKGGAQRVFDHATAFSERLEVIEAVFNEAEDERLYDSGLPLHSLDVPAGQGPVQKLRYLFQRARRLRSLIAREGIGVTISHMDGANIINVLSATREVKILVVHGTVLHDHGQSGRMRWLRRRILAPLLYNRATCTVAVSDAIAHELRSACGVRNVVSIPNFFDTEAIRRRSTEALPEAWASLFDQPDVLVTSGRLSEQKKQASLIGVFKAVRRERPGACLVILGDGELRAQLLGQMKAAGLSVYTVWDDQPLTEAYDVYFPGYVANPFAFLSRSRLFLFPSGWEGFPMALCEAMACGVPVLSADCPTGPRQILAPGTNDPEYRLQVKEASPFGMLLPMADKDSFTREWSEAVLELLRDPARCAELATRARNRVQDFDKATVTAQWLQLIEQLNGKKVT